MSVHLGSVLLGIVAVVLACLELSVLLPYLFGIEEFNPIENNMKNIKFQIDEFMKAQELNA
jgi:hypothetical protein